LERDIFDACERDGANMVILESPNHIWFLVTAAAIWLIALLPIRRIVDARDLSVGQKVYWSLVVAALPVLGALVWLGFYRGRR
jgi:hypothetical protein